MRELYREFAAARMRAKDEHVKSMALARNIVAIYAMSRAKKRVPSLQELVGDLGGPDKKQTVGQIRSALHVLSGQYGIPLATKVH